MEDGGPGGLGINELAMRVGVTPRTVRYYITEGLIPPPAGGGQHRVYNEEHLLRLQAIRRLKEAYLPLDEIRRQLAGASLVELRRIAESQPSKPPSSALEYVNSLLSAQAPHARLAEPRLRLAEPASPARPAPAPAEGLWRRVPLAPGVELHYQPSNSPDRDAAIARLISEGVRLLSEPGPPPDARP